MSERIIKEVYDYVHDNIGSFHEKRIENLKKLKLSNVLKRKNPYLFKAKYCQTAESIVKEIIDAFLSSREETLFGNWLEGLAIFVNQKIFNGWKSGITGVDLEFNNNGIRNIVSIKSGPNWGNSSQIKKMISDFKTAKKTLRTSDSNLIIIPINGCCYGKDNNPDKGEYYKYCGQLFWSFISNNDDLYREIIEPIGFQAKERNNEFYEEYSSIINVFTRGFIQEFCNSNGKIDWDLLLKYNSGK